MVAQSFELCRPSSNLPIATDHNQSDCCDSRDPFGVKSPEWSTWDEGVAGVDGVSPDAFECLPDSEEILIHEQPKARGVGDQEGPLGRFTRACGL